MFSRSFVASCLLMLSFPVGVYFPPYELSESPLIPPSLDAFYSSSPPSGKTIFSAANSVDFFYLFQHPTLAFLNFFFLIFQCGSQCFQARYGRPLTPFYPEAPSPRTFSPTPPYSLTARYLSTQCPIDHGPHFFDLIPKVLL